MDASLVNALGTIGFGGGVAVVISFFHNQQLIRLHDTFERSLKQVCASFEHALERRDKDMDSLSAEIRLLRSEMHHG
jgi:hypothetical protein